MNQLEAQSKLYRVFKSCETKEHFLTAYKYLELFELKYGESILSQHLVINNWSKYIEVRDKFYKWIERYGLTK